jgi:ATP-dependent DNA ligase
MTLPLKTPYPPMEALLVDEIPAGEHWQYEPNWDGFRCLAFRDRDKIELQSKSGQSLTRYFPELVDMLLGLRPTKFVLDAEIAVPVDGRLSFDDLLQRIHPAASRVKKLATERPALLIVFDILVNSNGRSLIGTPLRKRRQQLQTFAKKHFAKNPQLKLSPATTDAQVARRWFGMSGGSLDGVIAKPLDLDYRSGERAMRKIKRLRTADCVVGGFRYASGAPVVGSLLLGLYDKGGLLHHVGFTSSFSADERKQLLGKLKPLVKPPGFTGNAPGGPSRWSSERSGAWEPLVSKLVAEVRYDHTTGGRFRHGTRFLRWRPDKSPKQCSISQVETESRALVSGIDSAAAELS